MVFKDFSRMATTDSIIYHGVCRAALSMPAVLNIIIGFFKCSWRVGKWVDFDQRMSLLPTLSSLNET